MRTVVISQPMFFPWPGHLEQLRLADVYVHYDDVQFSKGSFTNRVQVKTASGVKWLTVPLADLHLGQRIRDVRLDEGRGWRARHVALLAQAYETAPFVSDMVELVASVYARPWGTLADLSVASFDALADYFGLGSREVAWSSQLGIGGSSDDRVLAIVKRFGGSRYVTGHGARNYLDHARFEAEGVDVAYLDYRKTPYPQLHGPFTPFVSSLDLVAHMGRAGAALLSSPAVPWRDFLAATPAQGAA